MRVLLFLLLLLPSVALAQGWGGGPHYGPQNTGSSTPSTITLNSVTLSNNSVASGPGGTIVGALSVATTPGGWFYGYPLVLSNSAGGCNGTTGADNASFQIVGGNQLAINGIVAVHNGYAICVVATQTGATGSPLGQAFTVNITAGNVWDAAVWDTGQWGT